MIIAVILVCSISVSALAVNDIDDLNMELDKQQQAPSTGNNLWLDFFKLVIVLGLIVGAAWSIIKLFNKQLSNKMQGTWIQVVDEVTLGQNSGIILCEVGEKLYAIGISDHNINLLFEIDNPKLLEEISYANEIDQPQKPLQWNELVSAVINKVRPGQPSEPDKKQFQNLMDEQFLRLEKLSDAVGKNESKIKKRDEDG